MSARLVLFAIALLSSACSQQQRPTPGGAAPQDFVYLRHDFFEVNVRRPQAEWNPAEHSMLARARQGVVVLAGSHRIRLLTVEEFAPWHPQWINQRQIVFGPDPVPTQEEDGTLVPSSEELLIADLDRDGIVDRRRSEKAAARPRPWGKRIVASYLSRIVLIDRRGREELFGEGFAPEPEREGEGIAWRNKPLFQADHWTGVEGVGELIIRWRPGMVDVQPGGLLPRWTPWGGICYTVLQAPPPAEGPWYQPGSAVYHRSGPHAEPVLLMADAHACDPHPTHGVAAVVSNAGPVYLVSLDGRDKLRIADRGERPRWSADGRRLMLREPHEDIEQASILRVHIFTIRGEGAEAAGAAGD